MNTALGPTTVPTARPAHPLAPLRPCRTISRFPLENLVPSKSLTASMSTSRLSSSLPTFLPLCRAVHNVLLLPPPPPRPPVSSSRRREKVRVLFRHLRVPLILSPAQDDGPEPKKKKKKKTGKKKSAASQGVLRAAAPGIEPERLNNVSVTQDNPSSYHNPQLPSFFPRPLAAAVSAMEDVDRTPERQVRVGLDTDFPIPKNVTQATHLHGVPRTNYFANTSTQGLQNFATEETKAAEAKRRVSRALFAVVQIWPYLQHKISSRPLDVSGGMTGKLWGQVMKHNVSDPDKLMVMKHTGLDVLFEADAEDLSLSTHTPLLPHSLPSQWFDILVRLGEPHWAGRSLGPYTKDSVDWLSPDWQRFILWSIGELEFRHTLLSFDMVIRFCHPGFVTDTAQVRYAAVTKCWGGGSAVPTEEENALCAADIPSRFPALVAFRELMRGWPRTAALLPTWVELEHSHTTLEQLTVDQLPSGVVEKLEREVWVCYIQIHFDYKHVYPALPFLRPSLPYSDLDVDTQ